MGLVYGNIGRAMTAAAASSRIAEFWDQAIVPALVEYIRIPAKSPHFDAEWRAHGHIDAAVALAERWCRRYAVPGMKLEVLRLPGRTPLLLVEIPATRPDLETVVVYGHLDKQPEMTGWRAGMGPWTPVIEDGKLYGRGSADDGYAVFCALSALRSLEEEKRPHGRCVLLIESCEESGSYDLPAYLDTLAPRIGTPALVIGLDSGCGNYEQLWGTTSLRGLVNGVLTVEVLTEGVPPPASAGNVLRPKTSLVLSRRLPPTVQAEAAAQQLKAVLEANPPYGAKVRFDYGQAASGWHAPPTEKWLEAAVDESSRKHFGKPAMWMGEGGTIPFMAMLGAKYPQAQFLITGVLGPHSNAHGPNEFLHLDCAKRLTACVADVLAAHAAR